MSLRDRQALITRTLRHIELAFPLIASATLIELTCVALARDHGLTVTPDEVTRVLAQAAGFVV